MTAGRSVKFDAPPTAEDWRPIPGFPDYWVSNTGRVASTRRGGLQILSVWIDPKGYHRLPLRRPDRHRVNLRVHQLVAEAFVGPRPPGAMVRHLDGNPANNTPGNLAWGTSLENIQDTIRHGRHRKAALTSCSAGHPFDDENTRIDRRGHRVCRACQRDWKRAWKARRRAASVAA